MQATAKFWLVCTKLQDEEFSPVWAFLNKLLPAAAPPALCCNETEGQQNPGTCQEGTSIQPGSPTYRMLLEIARSCTKQNRQGSHSEFFTALLELLKDNISPKFCFVTAKVFSSRYQWWTNHNRSSWASCSNVVPRGQHTHTRFLSQL